MCFKFCAPPTEPRWGLGTVQPTIDQSNHTSQTNRALRGVKQVRTLYRVAWLYIRTKWAAGEEMGGENPSERNEMIAGEPGAELVIWYGIRKINERKSSALAGMLTQCAISNCSFIHIYLF